MNGVLGDSHLHYGSMPELNYLSNNSRQKVTIEALTSRGE